MLAAHALRHIEDDDKIFECYYCGKRFSRKNILNRHIHLVHPISNRRYTCDLCHKE